MATITSIEHDDDDDDEASDSQEYPSLVNPVFRDHAAELARRLAASPVPAAAGLLVEARRLRETFDRFLVTRPPHEERQTAVRRLFALNDRASPIIGVTAVAGS